MRVISVVNAKGGTAKTTTAIYLATAFAGAGSRPVVLVDLDPQGSAGEWAERAQEAGEPLPFEVLEFAGQAEGLSRLVRRGFADTLYVLDTPPADPATIDAAIGVSDFVVVPTRTYGIELARVWETLPSLEGVDHAVLITSARLGTRSLGAVLGVLDEMEVPRFHNVIALREAVADSWGGVPTRLHGYGEVAEEIMDWRTA